MRRQPQQKRYQFDRSRRSMLETLEARRLMATINVTSFGAVPNDGIDDTNAVKAAINGSDVGDIIQFSAGVFDLPTGMIIPGNRTYSGGPGATLRGKNAEGWLFKLQQDNTTFQNLTFQGGGIFVERLGGGKNQNIVIN